MSLDIFKSCTQTPKSGKIFWKGQGKVRKFWKVEVLATLITYFKFFDYLYNWLMNIFEQMQDTLNDCFMSKKHSMIFCQMKVGKYKCSKIIIMYFAAILLLSCLVLFIWLKVILHKVNWKQLLQISCIWWCLFAKVFFNHKSKFQIVLLLIVFI